jgi:hypothetical protein
MLVKELFVLGKTKSQFLHGLKKKRKNTTIFSYEVPVYIDAEELLRSFDKRK